MSNVQFIEEPQKHLIWFVHEPLSVDPLKVTEVFIDATYNTLKLNTHFYAIVAEELGYGVLLGFMMMEVHLKEDTKTNKHAGEATVCNKNFYWAVKVLGINLKIVHTDKGWLEINAAQVRLNSS